MIHQQVEDRKLEFLEGSNDLGTPSTTTWKGTKMVISHSIRSAVKEIIAYTKSLDVVKIGIVGDPSTGKSTLAKLIGHLIHTHSEVPFTVRIFNKDNLLNFRDTLKSLEPANYVLLFQDVSFLGANADRKQLEMAKQALTEIRHLPGGQDVKIVMSMEYHYNFGLDKYVRQSNFTFWTSVGSSEVDNMEKLVGNRNMPFIYEFQKMYNTAVGTGKWYYQFPGSRKDRFLTYLYKNPFIPVLFLKGQSLRHIVSPSREWVEPICSVCKSADGQFKNSVGDADTFIKDGYSKFTEKVFKAALSHKLRMNGLTIGNKPYVQAEIFIERALQQQLLSLEELAVKCRIKLTKTRLRLDRVPLSKRRLKNTDKPKKVEIPLQIENDTKNPYSQYDSWNYDLIVSEIEKMVNEPPEKIDRAKYDYLQTKASELIKASDLIAE